MKTLGKLLISIVVLIVLVAVWIGIPFLFGAVAIAMGAPTWVGYTISAVVFIGFLVSNRLKNRRV